MRLVTASKVPLLLTAAAGIAMSAAIGLFIHRQQTHYFQREVQAGAENRFASIVRETDVRLTMLSSVNGILDDPQSMTRQRFEQVASAIKGGGTSHVISWLPRVDAGDRQAVERRLPALGSPTPWFTEADPATGETVRAPERAHYYPVLFAVPGAVRRKAIGFNAESRPESRAAMRQASKTRRFAATGAIRYVGDSVTRVALYAPVYSSETGGGSPSAFIAIGLRTEEVIEEAMTYLQPVGMHIELWDDTEPNNHRLLYRHASRAATVEPAPTAPAMNRAMSFANRSWRIVCIPAMPPPSPASPLLAVAAGFVITFSVVRLQRHHIARTELVEVRVRERTDQLQREIAERRRTEAQLAVARDEAVEASRLKSEFLANVSHELRTPLNGVVGTTEMLLSSPVNKEQREWLGIIRESANSLLHLISDVLDSSRMEAGGLRLEVTEFSPESVLESALDIVADRAQRKGLDLAGWVEAPEGTTLRGDANRIRQVLLNLLSNAVKFTFEGSVTMRAWPRPDDPLVWRFEVSDSGIGIDEASQSRLFQRFVQVDGTSTRQFGGTGLGLSISRQLVELMDGSIGVQSTAGKGSTFWFEVPLLTTGASAAANSARPQVRAVVDAGDATAAAVKYWLGAAVVPSTGAVQDSRTFLIARADSPLYATWPGPRIRLRHLTDPLTDGEAKTQAVNCPIHRSRLFQALEGLSNREPAEEGAAGDAARQGRILLVEDNAVNRKVAHWMLSKLGFEVESAEDGVQALEALRGGLFDAVLMDCQMPRMDGYEATRLIRELPGRVAVTPIIALTANAMQGDREQCLAAGMDDYIAKPLNIKTLASTLDRWLPSTLAASQRAEGLSL